MEPRPDTPFDAIPGPYGAHNWHPMSCNPTTGLVYLPAQNVPVNLMDDKEWKKGVVLPGRIGSGTGWNTGMVFNGQQPTSKPFGRLLAWDPVAQKEAWHVEHVSPWNGGRPSRPAVWQRLRSYCSCGSRFTESVRRSPWIRRPGRRKRWRR